jgi:hypothetical protein
VHFDFDLPGQFAAQIIDMDPGSAVDLGRKFACK